MLLSITQYFANNIRLLSLLILMIILLGVTSLLGMPKAEDPQFDMPINVVEVIAPGVSPLELESKVVEPIERSLGMVEDIKTIEVEIKQGAATFTIRSLYGTDPDGSYDEVVRAVGRVQPTFPAGVQNTLFIKASPITVNAVQYAVSSPDNDWQTLQRTSSKLQKKLQALPVVRQAEIWGLPRLVVQVAVAQDALFQHKLSIEQVKAVLARRGDPNHAGYIDNDEVRFTITLSGEYKDFKQLANTVIKSDDKGHVLLSDVADLNLVPFKPDNLAFLNGEPVVYVTAQQRMGTNIFNFGEGVRAELDDFLSIHPEVSVVTTFDQELGVQQRVTGFLYDLFYGLILILFCLLFFMGPKQSFWVSLALPLTIFLTLVTLNAFGFVLQQMTIAGLIVSLGLLVDNSLVVVEQFAKHKGKNDSNIQTIKMVLSEVGMPLVAGTLTTVLAFLPMLLLQSDTGDFMRALPVSVTIALLASLVVALVILPALMSVFGVTKHSKLSLSHYLNLFADTLYTRFLGFCLRWPVMVIVIFIAVAGVCISLFPKVGVSLFPKAEKNIVIVNVETPQFSSITRTQTETLKLSQEFESMENVTAVMATVGSSNPRIYYNHVPRRGVANFAQIMILVDGYETRKIQGLITSIREKYRHYEGAKVNVFEFQQGPVTDRPITVRILGDDLQQLAERSQEIRAYLERQDKVFDVRNISGNSGFAYEVEVDEYKAARANVDVFSAEQQIRALIDGGVVGRMKDKYGQSFDIMVQGGKLTADSLKNAYVSNQLEELVPLSSIASIELNKMQPPFYHYQRNRMNSISADVLPGGNVAAITKEFEAYLQSLAWRDGLTFKIGGEEEARKENFGGMSEIMILVVISIFVILFLQFNSFAQPGIIISLLPIAFAGGVFGMYMTGISFSMMAFIGLISLIGIMVNDAIIVVDGFNRGRAQSIAAFDAMIQSACSRFTPVILTSLTTIVGLLPLTLYGGDLWQPMGTVIITGLLFTTLASLVWVPVLTIKLAGKK